MKRHGRGFPLAVGAVAGLLLGWLLPMLLGSPIAAFGTTLRDNPRMSDAVVGAGGFLVYIAEAPGMYIAEHLRHALPAPDLINAIGWTLSGLLIGGFVAAFRESQASDELMPGLAAGALGGMLFGWLIPSISRTLGACFAHCWMHEGILGEIARIGGDLLRAVGVLGELPWRLLAGGDEQVTPLLAAPVSAAVWAVIGMIAAAAVVALRQMAAGSDFTPDPGAPEGDER